MLAKKGHSKMYEIPCQEQMEYKIRFNLCLLSYTLFWFSKIWPQWKMEGEFKVVTSHLPFMRSSCYTNNKFTTKRRSILNMSQIYKFTNLLLAQFLCCMHIINCIKLRCCACCIRHALHFTLRQRITKSETSIIQPPHTRVSKSM